ncbi:MAG: hypothetical protein H7Z71_11655 [Moraxellaceae bacterium]|nr:hypothetical protein [Pseudobdellovibrionaceae bacterium]
MFNKINQKLNNRFDVDCVGLVFWINFFHGFQLIMIEVLNQDHRNPIRQVARSDQVFDRLSFG